MTPAGFFVRIKAFSLDYLLILPYLVLVLILSYALNSYFPDFIQIFFADRITSQVSAFILITLPVSLYFALSEGSTHQATWGKKKFGLLVINQSGNQLTLMQSLTRTLVKFLPWELAHTLIWTIAYHPESPPILITTGFGLVYLLIGLNILSLFLRKDRQTLYDWLTGTYVISLT